MKRCALLTCDSLVGFSSHEEPLELALSERGWQFEWVSWRKEGVSWDQFDSVLIRTTWDYTKDPDLFLKKLDEIERSTAKLFNPLSLFQWNRNKYYLKELEQKGIRIVPTEWISHFAVDTFLSTKNSDETFVIKPQIGAGSANTFLIKDIEDKNQSSQLHNLQDSNVMIQPFMESIQKEGEYSVHFFDQEFSHAILKKPKKGDFRSQEEFGSEIASVDLSSSDLEFCHQVIGEIPEDWLYARVDFVRDLNQQPCLMELELIEPSLYFQYDLKSAALLVEKWESKINC